MSTALQTLCWKVHLPPNKKFLLIALADHGHDDGSHIFPSVAHLQSKTGLARRTIQRLLRELEQDGILQCVSDRRGGPHRTAVYQIVLDALPMLPDTPPSSPDDDDQYNSVTMTPLPDNSVTMTPLPDNSVTMTPLRRNKGVIDDTKGVIDDTKGVIDDTKGVMVTPKPSITIREPSDGTIIAHAHAREDPPPELRSASMVWGKVGERARVILPGVVWQTWMQSAHLYHLDDDYILLARSNHQAEIIRGYEDVLLKALQKLTRTDCRLLIDVAPAPPASLREEAVG